MIPRCLIHGVLLKVRQFNYPAKGGPEMAESQRLVTLALEATLLGIRGGIGQVDVDFANRGARGEASAPN